MTPRTFSTGSLVTCWLLVLTQHKQLVEELAGTKGLRLDKHVHNLAVHLMAYLEDGTIDPKTLQNAQRAHAAVGAFEGAKRYMSVFVLDAFALTAHAAGLPQMGTFDAINTLALAHGAPAEQGTLASRAQRAVGTLSHLQEHRATTGTAGVKVALGFAESTEGMQALRVDSKIDFIDDNLVLLGLIKDLTDQTQARELLDTLIADVSQ